MKTSKTATAKKAVASKTTGTKAPANKAATKNIPIRKTAPEKKAFVKAKAVVKAKPKDKDVSKPVISNHIISKAKGKEMVGRFSANLMNMNKINFSHGMEFDKSLFENLLALDGVKKIRIYNAVNADNMHTFVITAAGEKDDIYFKTSKESQNTKMASRTVTVVEPPIDDEGVGNMGSQCPAYAPGVKAL
jgi:hypothetical protein